LADLFTYTLRHRVAIGTQIGLDPALEAVPEEVIRALVRLVRETRFGSIEIVVHEGRVTQIERREKVRFAPPERQK
jgi:hypothetical protein